MIRDLLIGLLQGSAIIGICVWALVAAICASAVESGNESSKWLRSLKRGHPWSSIFWPVWLAALVVWATREARKHDDEEGGK